MKFQFGKLSTALVIVLVFMMFMSVAADAASQYIPGLRLGTGNLLITNGTFTVKDINLATKFSIAPATGNTVIAGTLGVTGASTFTGAATFAGAVTASSTIAGAAEGNAIINSRHRVTTAEINAGHTLITVPAALKFRLVSAKAVPYGGAATGSDSVDVLVGASKLVAFTIGDGWLQSTSLQDGLTQKAKTASGVILADGASYITQAAGADITIGKTGADLATCTGIDIVLSYVLEL